MGGKVLHPFVVSLHRANARGMVLGKTVSASSASALFWWEVCDKAGSMFPGDRIVLSHGARTIREFPPPAKTSAGNA